MEILWRFSSCHIVSEAIAELIGVKKNIIAVNMAWKKQKQKYFGWIAQIIQHDMTTLMELLSDNCLTEK
jgi:hypothetical protein